MEVTEIMKALNFFALTLLICTIDSTSAKLDNVHRTKSGIVNKTASQSLQRQTPQAMRPREHAASMGWNHLQHQLTVSSSNLALHSQLLNSLTKSQEKTIQSDQPSILPNQPAKPFQLLTLNGVLTYPSPTLSNTPMILHAFDNHSAFLECLWTSKDSLESLVSGIPDNTHLVFIPTSDDGLSQATWMKSQIDGMMEELKQEGKIRKEAMTSLQSRLHFVVTSVYQLGNWIPTVLQQWACQDHGCGLKQVVFQRKPSYPNLDLLDQMALSWNQPLILKRLDARYDWLPSPAGFGNKSTPVALSGDGCKQDASINATIAVVSADGCSFSKKISTMGLSGASAVIVYANPDQPVQDMNCNGDECDQPPEIPATMVPYSQQLLDRLKTTKLSVSFQTTPTNTFYFGIDGEGLLAEMGWLLYPSFKFFNWQAQWFNFKSSLLHNLSSEALIVPVINNSIMQGEDGIVATIKLPSNDEMAKYNKLELDASLSCPGTRDEECPLWDHTVQLYLCCNETSQLCGMELGRWITPFRRRIGRWLTDVTPLLPGLTSNSCTLTMKTVAWAEAWKPSLNLRFSVDSAAVVRPFNITPLFQGGTFDKNYNKNYKPFYFTISSDIKKVQVYAVITGHGSDNNGCGEFCVTSHHFIVNGHPNNITFDNAGTPLGCALRTPTGVEPNEHGTWVYGRDGWCDGREVDPWVFDITLQTVIGENKISYFGWFDGKDPNPTSNPGNIIMFSYLVLYK
ncbi:uncharacterized protein [Asterias amurensis]|uniref:uncharacterized protein n=1 Tax=Asterias amurensis TaxID=7602 RepID=UPI003AB825B8